MLEPHSNEVLDLMVILTKLDLLSQLGNTTFKLSDLFPLHEHANNDYEFKIPTSFRYMQMEESVSDSHQKFAAHIRKLKKENYCAAVGYGSEKFPDAWLWVYPTDSDEHFVFYIQSKRRRNIGEKATPGAGVDESVETEHTKCKFLPDRHVFIYITDERKKEKGDFKANEIVITYENHSKIYGNLMALRKSYST